MTSNPEQGRGDVRGTGVPRLSEAEKLAELSVVTIGGFVMDALIRIPTLPPWGEAVQAERFELLPGGKGFNQAVAARQLGAKVAVIGAVGNDPFGEEVLSSLTGQGIDASGLEVVVGAITPVTIVLTHRDGNNAFIGWKNEDTVKVDADLVRRHRSVISQADVLLMTLEVSPEAVGEAIRIATRYNVLTVLNPAPPLDRPYQLSNLPLKNLNLLIPNEWEARKLAGPRGDGKYSIRQVAEFFGNEVGVRSVCITRAHQGCVVYRNKRYREYPAYDTEAEDTTGASDAFCAVLAVYLRAGYEMEEAVQQAQAAGAWVVTRSGAARHMPSRDDLERHRVYLDSIRRE
jgi:ribokinase